MEVLDFTVELIMLILLIGGLYFLFSRGRFVITRMDGKYVKKAHSVRFSYKYFSGIKDFVFVLPTERPITMTYETEVEQGELIILVTKLFGSEKNAFARVEIDADTEGEVTFTPKKSFCAIRLEGIKTKGSCYIQLTF